MKKIFRRKKKSPSEVGSVGSGLSGSAYNISPKKDLGKLHRAAFEGDLSKLKSLLKKGDVNQLDKENRTPLHLACANGKYEAVRMISEHPNVNLNLCDNDRKSALMKCVQCEHQTCLKILLDKEADVSLCDVNGNTALHIAASIPNSDICYLLCDHDANPRAKNKDGATPLHIAASLGSDEVVKLFLGLGVGINDIDDNEKTALMNAAQKGHLTTVKLLLSKNADTSLRDLNGWTADDYASMDGYHPISHVIVEHNTKRGMASAASHQSTISRTPKTTPQKLGRQSDAIGGPALECEDDTQSEDSFSASKATEEKNSWASSDSEDDGPKYAQVPKKSASKPKINVMQAFNLKKKGAESTSPAPTSPQSVQPPQSPSKATANLFLTSTARQQIEKQESQSKPTEEYEEKEMRGRYDSKSSRGLPVSPAKPPLPKQRTDRPHEEPDDGDDSSWDSTGTEDEPQNAPQPVKTPGQKPGTKPNEKMLKQLGFDAAEAQNLYGEDESDSGPSSPAVPATPSPTRTKDTMTVKTIAQGAQRTEVQEESDWDDSFSENNASGGKKEGAFNFLQGSSNLKFDDEIASEPPKVSSDVKQNQLLKDEDHDDDDSSSWDSDNLVKPPEEAPSKHEYISSPSNVLKDAEKMVSPKNKQGLQQKIAEREQNKGLGFNYGAQLSDEDTESEPESESSWERDNITRNQRVLNNKKDLETERQRLKEEERRIEEERKKKLEEEERVRREDEHRKKLEAKRNEEARLEMEKQLREEEEKKKLEEKRLKQEEEEKRRRELEELEKLNKMNEELERKNAELKRKALEEERKKKEEEEILKMETSKTLPMNESLRAALERVADVGSESGDSVAESSQDEKLTGLAAGKKANYPSKKSAPAPATGSTVHSRTPFEGMNAVDLDTLTEETETDDDLSLSEGHPPALRHTSPLSNSLVLAQEKQNLTLQLAKEQDLSASAQEKLERLQKEHKQTKLKEKSLLEEKKTWELEKVESNAENRKLNFDVNNLKENLETVNLKLSKQDERCKRMEEQLRVEREERKQQDVLVRDLRIELKNANSANKQAELECEELRKTLETERKTQTLALTMNEDNFKLNESLQNEALRDNKVDSLEQAVREKNQELIKVKAERDRYEDSSARYKSELSKLRSEDADQYGNLVQLNQELNDKLDEKEAELKDSEEALQFTTLQSIEFKRVYENNQRQLADERREKENLARDLEMLNNQQAQLKRDLEDARSSFLREQERTRKLEDSQERMRDKEADLQSKLLSAETKASRVENDLQMTQSSNKQRAEDTAKWENECDKLKASERENEKTISKLQRELAEQSGKIEAMKIELHQRESECVQMRQEKEDIRSRNAVSSTEQQEKFNVKLAALQREHQNERVAFETRNVQLEQQIEHWKSEVERAEREKAHKDEELAQAQQDRIETHKKLGYADAFSKSASKEQKQLMDENMKVKEDNVRLQSQVTLLEQKVEEKSSAMTDLQKEVDRFYQSSANANRKIDSLSESQRLAESSRAKLEQQLKDSELENIRIKSELESANSLKEKLQESREGDAHAKAVLEDKVSKLGCEKVLIEEKLASEVANAKMLRSEADGHKNMWEAEVKSRSKLEVELSKAGKELEDERIKTESLRNRLTKASEERKAYKTRYEQMKREKAEADRRAESYRSAMHDAGRKVADTESECESQLSMMDEQYNSEVARREATIAKLREQVTDLSHQLKEKKRPYFPEGPSDDNIGSDEIKRTQFENERLKEELKQLRDHVKNSYVDKAELESARQEERIKAQAAIAPTLDQVNSFLKNQQLKYDFLDQVREKREEGVTMGAMMKIAALEDQLKTERRRNENADLRRLHQEEAEMVQRFEATKRENEILKQQLERSASKVEEYKGNWIKERKKFQSFFSNTLGGSIVPNGTDHNQPNLSPGNSLPFSLTKFGSSPIGGAFSSTPKKDTSDPLLAQLRSKLDATIAQRLSAPRDGVAMSHSVPVMNGHLSPRSSSGTPRSDRSSHPYDVASTSGRKGTQNEYMSFLLT